MCQSYYSSSLSDSVHSNTYNYAETECSSIRFGTLILPDLDECALGSDACREGTFCRNTPGSYECTCADGYQISADGNTSCEGMKRLTYIQCIA